MHGPDAFPCSPWTFEGARKGSLVGGEGLKARVQQAGGGLPISVRTPLAGSACNTLLDGLQPSLVALSVSQRIALTSR